MTKGLEPAICDEWLYGVLSGNATITGIVGTRVFNEIAPDDAIFPYVVFFASSPGNDYLLAGPANRLWSRAIYTVKGVAQQSSYGGNLLTLFQTFDSLLDGKTATVTRGEVVSCVRQTTVKYAEKSTDGGVPYRHLGATFIINAR